MTEQTNRKRKVAVGTASAGALMIAMGLATHWEGESLVAYQDVVGVWTLCDGETKGVRKGDTATHAQCQEMLAKRLAQFSAEIAPCLPAGLPDKTEAAFIDVAYNIGSSAFCKSSISKRALAGDLSGACDALLLWNKGRIAGILQPITGLTNRRKAERQTCHEGLAGL